MSVDRIREAAHTLRVTYLPIMRGAVGEDWRKQVDVAEVLADLLQRQADAIEDIRARAAGSDELMIVMPEYAALFALVEKIEEVR